MGQGPTVTAGPARPSFTRRALLAGAASPLLGCDSAPAVSGTLRGAGAERGHLLRRQHAWPAPAAMGRVRVLIAGAGVAGLAASRALRQRGIDDFALLELEDLAGGNSRGSEIGGIACPLGAHYLPVPGDSARDVQDFLEEAGLRQRIAGRWVYDERHLCHAPQERLFFRGHWQDGLLPLHGVAPSTLSQYQRFAVLVEQAGRTAPFTIPAPTVPAAAHRALDAVTFAVWLDRQGLADAHLRWYLDYCCRDDYGAGIDTVSAWAGLHYFASRHGFQPPGHDGGEREAVLAWPEGNAWLTRRLAAGLGERLRPGRVVLRIAQGRHGVDIDAWNAATQGVERWQADHCIVALPLFVAARVVQDAPALLHQRARHIRYAPWAVANLHLREPLRDRPGAAPSWDNVIYGAQGLGYVDARHQSLDPRPGPTVLTWYGAPGEAARERLLTRTWRDWQDDVVAELSVPHPDLAGKLARIEVARYGHAMAIPVPGGLAQAASGLPRSGRLSFAHGDWAGYSIFEEAFTAGHRAGLAVV
ncbi:MAG TPA: NAD(P)-binding protein [Ramlibacter sp.]|nr:NAD(P)-binding protein [Ramlibacter sp.]